ncbi:hypothetical protein NST28_11805 [Paenibacillus sp. FSL R10-2791]|uniref:TRADD-N-associated membrane domain-containing protein n=1 Tax=Paenibacillus TaxID=44249 RepID=UPI0004F84656|nr:hypothetical protein [Paenibacillus odorifer]AIQ73904.1 hypothetical protein PODO_11995 [Paenibacillus odorifer]
MSSAWMSLISGVALTAVASLTTFAYFVTTKKIEKHTNFEVNEIAEILNKKKLEDEETRKTVKEYLNARYSTNDLSASITVPEKGNVLYGPPDDSQINKVIDQLNSTQTQDDPGWKLVETLVKNYHKQALTQANVQFYFSVAAAVTGLILLSYTLLSHSPADEKALSSIPVVITEGIAALFFKQAEQTRQRATELYDRLREDNVQNLSIELINSIEDENLRSVVKSQLALKMGNVDSTITELSSLIKEKQFNIFNS